MSVRVKVYCEGTTPLLMSGESSNYLGRKPFQEHRAAAKLYRDKEGGIIGITRQTIWAALRQAVGSLENAADQMIYIQEPFFPLVVEGDDNTWDAERAWVEDVRSYPSLRKGKTQWVARARFDRWGFCFTAEINEPLMHLSAARELFRVAGEEIGLGGKYPSRGGGPHGRFKVKRWEVQG